MTRRTRMVAAAALSMLVAALACACAGVTARNDDAITVKTVVVNGAELSYVEQGAGETVVFMHGTATDYRVWEEVRRRFGNDFRFVAYSRRHHAPNAWPDDGASHTMTQHADDLVAFIHALGVERAHVVALSLGGRPAAYAAVHHPEAFRTLIVSDALLAPPVSEEGKRAMAALQPSFDAMFSHIRAGNAKAAVQAYVDIASPGKGWSGMSATWQRYYLDNARTLVLSGRDTSLRPPGCEALATIPVPVLVMTGERAPLAIRATNEALIQCLRPGATSAEVPRAGHYWYADNPEDGTRLLREFLRTHATR